MRTDRQKEYSRQYYIDNKEKIQKKTSAYYFKTKALKPKKVCAICTNLLSAYKAKYCSEGCRKIGHKSTSLQSRFGIDIDMYNSMWLKQNNKCAICNEVCKSGKQLAVDHCHKTAKVRELLCRRCNQLLGQFDDNVELFKNTVKYLETHHQDLHSS